MNRFIFTLFLLGIAVIAKAATPPIILSEQGAKNLSIETAMAEEQDFESTVFSLGVTEAMPEKRSVLSSRIAGRVIETNLTVGSYVTKGDKLVLIESRQPGDPPPSVWLTAPANGTILSIGAVLGSPIEPSDTLAEIADLSSMFVVVTVPQQHVAKIKQGTKARVRFPVRPDKEYTATLLQFTACPCPDPACALGQDTSTRTNDKERMDRTSAGVVFTLENPDNMIRPGMNTECQIITSQRKNVISVPRIALLGEASDRYVFVKDFRVANAFVKTPVQIGETNDRNAEVVSGLFPADEVVTKGAYALSLAGGASGISLKEALDAAHGHEHAEDGSELTPEKKAAMSAKKHGGEEHTHEDGSKLWMYVSGGLFLLLLASLFTKLRSSSSDEQVTSNPEKY